MKKKFSVLPAVISAVVGFVLCVVGAYRGETVTIFEKAVRICLECIGIG